MCKGLFGAMIAGLLLAGGPAAVGQFVPDRLYIAGIPYDADPSDPEEDKTDVIVEFDPSTREWRVFATMPLGTALGSTGVTFMPDGSRLRVGNENSTSIYEVDPYGNVERVLGWEDGVFVGQATDNLAYGLNGDFYISQGPQVLRFAASGGPAEVFADFQDGLVGHGPIEVAPDGSVYCGTGSGARIYRFTPEGQGSLFDELTPGSFDVGGLAANSQGSVFTVSWSGLYRYDFGDPASR